MGAIAAEHRNHYQAFLSGLPEQARELASRMALDEGDWHDLRATLFAVIAAICDTHGEIEAAESGNEEHLVEWGYQMPHAMIVAAQHIATHGPALVNEINNRASDMIDQIDAAGGEIACGAQAGVTELVAA